MQSWCVVDYFLINQMSDIVWDLDSDCFLQYKMGIIITVISVESDFVGVKKCKISSITFDQGYEFSYL